MERSSAVLLFLVFLFLSSFASCFESGISIDNEIVIPSFSQERRKRIFQKTLLETSFYQDVNRDKMNHVWGFYFKTPKERSIYYANSSLLVEQRAKRQVSRSSVQHSTTMRRPLSIVFETPLLQMNTYHLATWVQNGLFGKVNRTIAVSQHRLSSSLTNDRQVVVSHSDPRELVLNHVDLFGPNKLIVIFVPISL